MIGNNKTLVAGVIGLGVGEHHVAVYRSLNNSKVKLICDLDNSRLSEIAERYGIVDTTNNWRDVVEDPDVDIVSISSYDDAHLEHVLAALENGKHVFVEKPICQFPNELEDIKNSLAEHPNLKLSSNLPLRTCPLFKSLRKTIRDGAMGKVYSIEADYLWGRPQKLSDGWRRKMPHYSLVLGASIHMIDLIIWLKGEMPIEVSGYGEKRALGDHKLGFDDHVVNLFRFSDGTNAKVSSHAGCAHPHFHALRVYGTEKSFVHELSGTYWIDGIDPNIKPRDESAEYPAKGMRGQILTSFVDHILNEENLPVISVFDALNTMEAAFAAEAAIVDGSAQSITALY